MSVTVRQLAELVQGEIVGDGNLLIHAARPLGDAQSGEITFVEDAKHVPDLEGSRASVSTP